MARVTKAGTFVFCNGTMLMDGWEIDCGGGDVLTQNEVLELILKHITTVAVEVPKLSAQLAALKHLERIKGKGAPDA